MDISWNLSGFMSSQEKVEVSSCSLNNLPPEAAEGNIEYKLKLVNPSSSRFEHLVSQMKWRLREGQGEAIYEIGVEDNGMLAGLSQEELEASLDTLNRMASRLGATTTILRERCVDCEGENTDRKACEVLVRRVPDDQQFIDLRIAVLGNVEAGKSTLLGVLTQGELDNGRGRARLNLFRHLHEIQSGRTSSISHEILGFNSRGKVINYCDSQQGCLTAEEICENASKLITLLDLAGHQKYIKTTIFGLMGYAPDFAMLVISASTGIAGTTREHLGLAMALQVPIFIVVSKMDICCSAVRQRTISQLTRLLTGPGCKKVPYQVNNEDDAVTAAINFNNSNICPIFCVSSVTGANMEMLKKFLYVLSPANTSMEQEKLTQELTEYQVDEVYSVPNVGRVVGGTLYRGVIKEDDTLLLGPSEEGTFSKVNIQSIHRNRSASRVVRAGQAATLALGEMEKPIRKGMVLVSEKLKPTPCYEFEADICILYHTTSVSRGYQATVHIGNVCQNAIICDMDKDSVKINEQALVKFRFVRQPEYIREGARILFREGSAKGLGQVTKVFALSAVER
ncbi:GTP-binding protein 2 [Strongylocentrotus purpuratus]|uniref:Tr-type G domain-containing protein n=1 Tax=Strongylocentrotus purpuratus TaxID=7668 RepID=A0A7M7PQ12_STRPU|nr:GTP-binding protein 2 [Strongylocentrotus purpuratus]|eukprot:XP_787032.3 PREDICTED: GTP-binding protein 2 isoform X1 [Strongylocentrotus purpuratus]